MTNPLSLIVSLSHHHHKHGGNVWPENQHSDSSCQSCKPVTILHLKCQLTPNIPDKFMRRSGFFLFGLFGYESIFILKKYTGIIYTCIYIFLSMIASYLINFMRPWVSPFWILSTQVNVDRKITKICRNLKAFSITKLLFCCTNPTIICQPKTV
jgi:hypothetical protein